MGRFQKPPGLAMPYDMAPQECESFGAVEMQAGKKLLFSPMSIVNGKFFSAQAELLRERVFKEPICPSLSVFTPSSKEDDDDAFFCLFAPRRLTFDVSNEWITGVVCFQSGPDEMQISGARDYV